MSTIRSTVLIPLALLAALLAWAGEQANTWTVNPDGSGDFATIQEAVNAASDGDVIVLNGGKFQGPGNHDVLISGKAVTIRSLSGEAGEVFIDCLADSLAPARAFRITGGAGRGTVLEGLTIMNGYGSLVGIVAGGGLLIENESAPLIRNCVFENNHAGMRWDHAGGAVYVDNYCTPLFEGCEFRGNSAFFGGAVGVNHYSQAEFVDCRFLDNVGGRGGAIWGNSTTKTRCLLARNRALEGGAVWGNGYNEERSVGCTYYANSAPLGGTIYALANYGGPVVLESSIISHGAEGAAIEVAGEVTVSLSCCNLYRNAGGDWTGPFAAQVAERGNFSASPCYCDPELDEFTLCADSFCLPGRHPWGCDQLVGAFGPGCEACGCEDVVDTEREPLGGVKAMFR